MGIDVTLYHENVLTTKNSQDVISASKDSRAAKNISNINDIKDD